MFLLIFTVLTTGGIVKKNTILTKLKQVKFIIKYKVNTFKLHYFHHLDSAKITIYNKVSKSYVLAGYNEKVQQ